jgi:hypothetical protein
MPDLPPGLPEEYADVFLAAVDLVRRTGSRQFQLRWQDDEKPTVWVAVAGYNVGDDGRPISEGGKRAWKVAAALSPLDAALCLCEETVDGAQCVHCKRPSGFDPDGFETMPLNDIVCWYQYDPELKTMRRGCEGDT